MLLLVVREQVRQKQRRTNPNWIRVKSFFGKWKLLTTIMMMKGNHFHHRQEEEEQVVKISSSISQLLIRAATT